MDLLPDANLSAEELLAIYLQDHLAAATGGLELFKRAAKSQLDPQRKTALARLAGEIGADRDTLTGLMDQLGVARPPLRVAAGWVAEKVGRLKPNGTLLRRSPLSDVIELEAMRAGVAAKMDLWLLLQRLSTTDERLQATDFERLLGRARSQYDELDELHLSAAEALRS
jgi:hypothetical protein